MSGEGFGADAFRIDLRGRSESEGIEELERAAGDPRWSTVRVLHIEGPTNEHARWCAYERNKRITLTHGSVTDEGTRALTELEVGSLHDNQISRRGLRRLLLLSDGGVQRLPPEIEPIDPSHFDGPAEPLDLLAEAWAQRLVDGVSELLRMAREARAVAPLTRVAPTVTIDRRWVSVVGEREVSSRIDGWAGLLEGLSCSGKPTPERVGAQRAIDIAAGAMRETAQRFTRETASWGPGLALAVAQVEGMLEDQEAHLGRKRRTPPLCYPHLDRYEHLRREILDRR